MGEAVIILIVFNLILCVGVPVACTFYLMERVFSVQVLPPKMKKQKAYANRDRYKPKIIQESDEIRIEKEQQETPHAWS